MKSLHALAALLSYPTAALVQALPEIRGEIAAERRICRRDRERLGALIDEIAAADLLELQEEYVALFDRGRATALNLFEHLHGDSRDRGQAMVDLAETYAKGGLALSTRELPDYLPVLLEYLSTRPPAEVKEMLGDCAHIVRGIGEALVRRESAYAAVPGALLAIAGEAGLEVPREALAPEDEPPLDETWAEAPVLFGCGAAKADPSAAQPIRFTRKVA
jgi:nitrate reductase delta subunit